MALGAGNSCACKSSLLRIFGWQLRVFCFWVLGFRLLKQLLILGCCCWLICLDLSCRFSREWERGCVLGFLVEKVFWFEVWLLCFGLLWLTCFLFLWQLRAVVRISCVAFQCNMCLFACLLSCWPASSGSGWNCRLAAAADLRAKVWWARSGKVRRNENLFFRFSFW